jgi:hypothetical protein
MSSQSNERWIKQFLLFFKIPESFSFSNATAKDRNYIILTLTSDVNFAVLITVEHKVCDKPCQFFWIHCYTSYIQIYSYITNIKSKNLLTVLTSFICLSNSVSRRSFCAMYRASPKLQVVVNNIIFSWKLRLQLTQSSDFCLAVVKLKHMSTTYVVHVLTECVNDVQIKSAPESQITLCYLLLYSTKLWLPTHNSEAAAKLHTYTHTEHPKQFNRVYLISKLTHVQLKDTNPIRDFH